MSYAATVLNDAPIAYWRLGESTGTSAADSASGAASLGVYTGTTGQYALAQQGALARDQNTAVKFDGAAGAVEIANTTILQNLADTFTLEAWVKRSRTTVGTAETIVTKGAANMSQLYFPASSNLLTLRRNSVADVVAMTTAITDTTTWHHVVCTKSGATLHMYLDGVDVTGSVANQTFATGSSVWGIGAFYNGSLSNFAGATIDEVAVYSTVLTATQVAAHYTAGATVQPVTSSPLPHPLGPAAGPTFFTPPILSRQPLDVWNDQLVDLSRWQTAGASWSVVGGQAFATSAGSYSYAQRPVPLLPGQPFRFAARVRRPLNTGTGRFGQTAIYVTSDSVSTVNGGGTGNLLAVGFDEGTTSPHARAWWIDSHGTPSYSATGAINAGAGDWLLTIQGDETYISLCVMSADGTQEFRAYATLASLGFVPQQVGFLSVDASTSTGSSIGPVGFRQGSLAPITPKTNLEDMTGGGGCFTGEAGGSGSNYSLRIGVPPGYDPAVGAPLAIYVHGFGGDINEPADNPGMSPACRALMQQGWLVLSSQANGDAWGNATSISTVIAAWRWATSHYNVTTHILTCVSMGAMLGLLIADGTIPFNGFMAFSPGVNLLWAWRANQNVQLGQAGLASINAAYGLTGGEADFLAKTSGHDPCALPANSWGTIPILLSSSPRDELADQSVNGGLLYSQLLTGTGRSTQNTFLHVAQGPHSAVNFMPPAVVTAFAAGVQTGTFANALGSGVFPNPLDAETAPQAPPLPRNLGPAAVGPRYPWPLQPSQLSSLLTTRGVSDTSLTTDSVTRALVLTHSLSDTSLTSDSIARALVLARSLTDTSLTTDSVARGSLVFSRSASDTSLTSDSIARALVLARSLTDTSLTTDSVARALVLARIASDTSLTSDAVLRALGLARSASETSLTSDSVAGVHLLRSTSDTTLTTDALVRALVLARSSSDTTLTVDSVIRAVVRARAAADTSLTSDSIARALVLARSLTDTSLTSDGVLHQSSRATSDTTLTSDVLSFVFQSGAQAGEVTSSVSQMYGVLLGESASDIATVIVALAAIDQGEAVVIKDGVVESVWSDQALRG